MLLSAQLKLYNHIMEKQWYKTWWGILIILCFFPLFIWGFLTKFIWNQKWSSKTRIISICLLWGIPIVFGQVFGNASQSVANTKVNTTAEYICIGPDGKKIKLEREFYPVFNSVIEIRSFDSFALYDDIARCVDTKLKGGEVKPEIYKLVEGVYVKTHSGSGMENSIELLTSLSTEIENFEELNIQKRHRSRR